MESMENLAKQDLSLGKRATIKSKGNLAFLLCATIDVAQVKPRAMHVRTEKAIALREKPPFDII